MTDFSFQNIFSMHSVEQHAHSIAHHMPGGEAFEGKNICGSNINKFLLGLSHELVRSEQFLSDFYIEFFAPCTEQFIVEWEMALGMPDHCFTETATLPIETRQLHVFVKLACMHIQTDEDYIALAAKFGITVTVSNAELLSTFPFTFPLIFTNTVKESRFYIVVNFIGVEVEAFPLTFPILFGDARIALLECLYQALAPSNCRVIFRQL